MKIFDYVVEHTNGIGFIITFVGTVVGIIALIMTILINKKTNKIEKNIKVFEVKASFNYIRLVTLTKLREVHSQYRNSGDYKRYLLEEVITELEECEVLYTPKFKEVLTEIKQELENDTKSKVSKKQMESSVKIVYKLITKLENNIDVIN